MSSAVSLALLLSDFFLPPLVLCVAKLEVVADSELLLILVVLVPEGFSPSFLTKSINIEIITGPIKFL